MSNNFAKEEVVAFEQIVEGFSDALVVSNLVNVFKTDSVQMERANNIISRPMPYVAVSYEGTDMTANFSGYTQLTVPATLSRQRSVPLFLSATELRDMLQEQRLQTSAHQKIASDINYSLAYAASMQGTVVAATTATAKVSGFDGPALASTMLNENGVNDFDRYLLLNSNDYQGIASELGTRANLNTGKTLTAYERASVGDVAGFSAYRADYGIRKTAKAGSGITVDTRTNAANYHTPRATSTAATGEISNVDNRYQSITVSSTTSVVAGDAFTIAGIESAHLIAKTGTGRLKTFRVISVTDPTHMVISPPIISAQGATRAELQYQNCIVTPASSASIVFLNTQTCTINPFWVKNAIELLPGQYNIPMNAGAFIMKGVTDQGVQITMQKQYDIKTTETMYRFDSFWGVCVVNPEMCGALLYGQT